MLFRSLRQWVWIAGIAGAASVSLGVLTTGAGPHAGDGGAARNDLNIQMLVHLHAASAYITLFSVVFVRVLAKLQRAHNTVKWADASVGVMILQIIVGVWQTRNALPPVLVGIHMVLATLLAATIVLMVAETYARVIKPAGLERK